MKLFRINQFFLNNNNFLNIPYYIDPYNRGFKNISDIVFLRGSQAISNLNILSIKIKKIFSLVQFLSSNEGIFVTLISEYNQRDWGISVFEKRYFEENSNICDLVGGVWSYRPLLKNFYIIIMSGIFGYISNLEHYYARITNSDLFILLRTNYRSSRKPTMVFITKHSLKQYKTFYSTYLKIKSIILKTKYVYDIDRNVGYDLYITKCILLYRVIMVLYEIPIIFFFRDFCLNYKFIMNKFQKHSLVSNQYNKVSFKQGRSFILNSLQKNKIQQPNLKIRKKKNKFYNYNFFDSKGENVDFIYNLRKRKEYLNYFNIYKGNFLKKVLNNSYYFSNKKIYNLSKKVS